jgi:ribose transport system substrate-binding protein
MLRRLLTALVILIVPAALVACGSSSNNSSGGSSTAKATPSRVLGATHGPNGETPTPVASVKLTPTELAKIKAGHYTAAMLWHTSDEVTAAVSHGAQDAFNQMGINVVATTNADYQADQQSNQLQTVSAKKPNIILSLPVDPTSTAAAYRAAAAGGAKLVFEDNAPDGFTKPGKQYVTVVSSDLFQMGKHAADALAAAIGDKGDIGYVFHDADFYVTNQRDQAFKKTIQGNYPGIHIVAEQGIADPSKAEEEANAMLIKHPNLKAIYVTFGEVAQGYLSALRNNGNTTTKIVTMDLQEPLALDMARGGQTAAIVVEGLYADGQAMARAGALSLIGVKVPPFIVSPATTVTRETLKQGYAQSEHTTPPEVVVAANGG